jgi:hypothetical protein
MTLRLTAASVLCVALAAQGFVITAQAPAQRTFATADEAVRALIETTAAGKLDELLAIFGAGGQELIASSDVATAQHNREVFSVAVVEGWHLRDQGSNRKTLVIGNEEWPFPVPLVKSAKGWRFDAAAGKEEVLARRVGRNELAAIGTCRTYVAAQGRYARQGHDGKPAGLFATTFRSDPDKHNGLYWPAARNQPQSPLGDLVAQASVESRSLGDRERPLPFYGYYFRILTAQGPAAPGGAKSYLVNGEMSGGFSLVAWPATYDASGVMTFVVNQSGIVYQQDLGPETESAVAGITTYDPGPSWHRVP